MSVGETTTPVAGPHSHDQSRRFPWQYPQGYNHELNDGDALAAHLCSLLLDEWGFIQREWCMETRRGCGWEAVSGMRRQLKRLCGNGGAALWLCSQLHIILRKTSYIG